MNCRDCKRQLYPTNPEKGTTIRGKYLKPLCTYCPGSTGGKPTLDYEDMAGRVTFLEELESTKMNRDHLGALQQLTGRVNYLQRQIKELSSKKESTKERNTTTIKYS